MATMPRFEAAGVRAFPLFLVADDDLDEEAQRAIEMSGAHVVERLTWQDIAIGLPFSADRPVVVLEASGVAEEQLASTLPHVAAFLDDNDGAAVISIDSRRIDVAVAALLDPRVQFLCDASLAERIGAIAVARETAEITPGPHDKLAEGEAARLHKLNEEVARIADVLARLTRHNGQAAINEAAAADRRLTFGSPTAELTIEPAEVRRAIRARRQRDQFFGVGLFEEPGWDMILDLFAAELEGTRVSVSSLCIAASVAPTTALRWISKLTDAGLFDRRPDPFDRRRAYMELSPRASEAMRAYVGALRRVGLSLG